MNSKNAVRASARKSQGEYKPLLVHPDGQTQIVEQSPERQERVTQHGIVPGRRYARGTAYPTREEAIAAAQRWIDVSLAGAQQRFEKYEKIGLPTHNIEREVIFWGGEEWLAERSNTKQ